jgi:hypothetical protein
MLRKIFVFIGLTICLQSAVLVVPVQIASAADVSEQAEAAMSTDAPGFQPLVGIPGVTDASNQGFGDYINALYRLSISLAALLAVIKIVAAGAKYMLSDIVTSKESAKDDIRGALVGLLIILGAFIILNTINTDITNNDFVIEELDGMDTSSGTRLRILSRLEAAQEVCAASGGQCVIEYTSREECDVKNGTFIDGSWWFIGESTFANRCFYDKKYQNNQYDTIACEQKYVDAMTPYTYDCSAAQLSCTSAGNTVISVTEETVTCLNKAKTQEAENCNGTYSNGTCYSGDDYGQPII